MAQRTATRQPEPYKPTYPFAIAMAVGYSFIFFLTLCLFLAFLATKEGLLAKPPTISWQFVAIFLGGTWSFTALQLGLLYRFRAREFWPQDAKAWLKCVSPLLPIVAATILPGLAAVWNATVAIVAITLLLGIAVGMVPTLLCVTDWLNSRILRAEDIVKLRAVEKSELPQSVRAYFEAHTDELNRLGFEQLGDFRIKEFTPTYSRLFLNRENDTFAEISHARVMLLPVRAVCFFSLTPDGHYLESSNARLAKEQKTRYFELQLIPQAVMRDVLEQHRAPRLGELEPGQPRRLTAENLESVIHYGNKKLYDLMIADGVVNANPYADFDESVLVPQVPTAGEIDATIFDTPSNHEMTAV